MEHVSNVFESLENTSTLSSVMNAGTECRRLLSMFQPADIWEIDVAPLVCWRRQTSRGLAGSAGPMSYVIL